LYTDLHCHTSASDGLLTPAALIRKALDEGIGIIAIADHDTIEGIGEAVFEGKKTGVKVIPACEFSIDYGPGDFHLLGYGIDCGNIELDRALSRIKTIRENRIPLMVERLAATGIDITAEEVFEEARGGSPGKPHLARVLVRKGFARSFAHAFDAYLGMGKPGDVPKEKIPVESAVSLIKNAGGIAVCAHPVSLELKRDATEHFLKNLFSLGIAGVEAYANMHDDDDVGAIIGMAERIGLIVTGGSDYHGDKGEILGCYGGGRRIPEKCSRDLLSLMEG
jgi:predicted metal-dependent phosphoesterase TrpH